MWRLQEWRQEWRARNKRAYARVSGFADRQLPAVEYRAQSSRLPSKSSRNPFPKSWRNGNVLSMATAFSVNPSYSKTKHLFIIFFVQGNDLSLIVYFDRSPSSILS